MYIIKFLFMKEIGNPLACPFWEFVFY